MSFARPPTVRSGLALMLSAGLAVVAWLTAYRWQPLSPHSAERLPALRAARDSLAGNEDRVREALRTPANQSRLAGWSEQALEKLPEQFGADWHCERRIEATATVVELQRREPRLEDWADYLAFTEQWSQRPGVSVESFEVLAIGPAHERRLTRVALTLRFLRAEASHGDASRSGPSPGPARVAPADRSAPPRKLGPVTSLRRPGASAEPPAPGPASASFRPDPPGSQAGP